MSVHNRQMSSAAETQANVAFKTTNVCRASKKGAFFGERLQET
jgi:hypothetical protein